jgi:hypothetical protein
VDTLGRRGKPATWMSELHNTRYSASLVQHQSVSGILIAAWPAQLQSGRWTCTTLGWNGGYGGMGRLECAWHMHTVAV